MVFTYLPALELEGLGVFVLFDQLHGLFPSRAEAAFTTIGFGQFFDELKFGCSHRNDEHLKHTVTGFPVEWFAVGGDYSYPLPTIVGVDHSAGVTQAQTCFTSRTRARQQQGYMPFRYSSREAQLYRGWLVWIGHTTFRHEDVVPTCGITGTHGHDKVRAQLFNFQDSYLIGLKESNYGRRGRRLPDPSQRGWGSQ
ncbi:hypothetical protein [Pseudomonas phage vB_Pae_HMKU_23]|nr:hypothetical protein [Pseudomonas phage vB_Pae_HMKU_23]